ncbi:MAG: SRPBCC family protein [Gammaproteobacteria bacterium]|nr:SRPBCC family protein [Gammaproteobacteria bacterium]
MAFARLAFRVLFILLLLFAVIGLLLPSSTAVERSIVIDAPPAEVFPHLNGMRAFHAWSPWSAIDPQTVYRFEGPEQGVGSRMTWASGNQQVGQGSQEITVSIPEREVETALSFGDKGNGTATFVLEPDGGATRVRWRFHTEFGWDLFSRYVGLMLDSMIGAQYDKGLQDLKALVEAPPVAG